MARANKNTIPKDVVIALGGKVCFKERTSTIEVYDISMKSWSKCKFDLHATYDGSDSCINEGDICVIGGFNGTDYMSSMHMYNFRTSSWEEKPPMFEARGYLSVANNNGKIYAVGGYDGKIRLKSIECFDPKTNQWERLANMQIARSDACAVSHPNGKIYVIGGFSGEETLRSVEIYDPFIDEWSFGPPLKTTRCSFSSVVYQGDIYVIGGSSGTQLLNTVEVLDPTSSEPNWVLGKSLTIPRMNLSASVFENKILVNGGWACYDGQYPHYRNSCLANDSEVYCGFTKEWSAGAPMTINRFDHCLLTMQYIAYDKYSDISKHYIKKPIVLKSLFM